MSSSETQTSVTVTPEALVKIREVMEQQALADSEHNLRIFVQGGGCSGPAFGLAFDAQEDGDTSFDLGGLTLVIDPVSLPYAQGATIDYVETPEVSGFKVTTPQDAAACGPGNPPAGGCSSGGCC